LHSSVWFYAGLITSYKQTAKPRNSDVEGTAQGNYLGGWGPSVMKRGTRHSTCRLSAKVGGEGVRSIQVIQHRGDIIKHDKKTL
jgi:hypothetical protein